MQIMTMHGAYHWRAKKRTKSVKISCDTLHLDFREMNRHCFKVIGST